MKDSHTYGQKMARNGRTKGFYKGTFISIQTLSLLKSTKIGATIMRFLLCLLCHSFRFQAHFYGCVKVKDNGKIAMFRLIGKLSDMVMKNHQNLCWIVSICLIVLKWSVNTDFMITAIFITQLLIFSIQWKDLDQDLALIFYLVT